MGGEVSWQPLVAVWPLGSAAELELSKGTHLPSGWDLKLLVMHLVWAEKWLR